MPLFKYLPKRFLDAFLARGSLRIGTLYEYRKVEQYGTVIGDADEGRHKTELSLAGGGVVDLATSTPEAEFFRQHVLRPDQQHHRTKIVLADGARLVSHTNSQDLYIFCVSAEYRPDVMREFGCDSCLEILHPQEFFQAVSRRIRHKGTFEGLAAVTYASKHTHYLRPHRVHPALMKEERYANQHEWRAIWTPTRPPRQPLLINVPRAIRHCRAVAA